MAKRCHGAPDRSKEDTEHGQAHRAELARGGNQERQRGHRFGDRETANQRTGRRTQGGQQLDQCLTQLPTGGRLGYARRQQQCGRAAHHAGHHQCWHRQALRCGLARRGHRDPRYLGDPIDHRGILQ
jgi:hypothetical protein